MAKIKIKDLPKDYKITEDEMKRIRGGLLISSQLISSQLISSSKSITPSLTSVLNQADALLNSTNCMKG
jgi:hypothetical protein